MHVVHGFPRGMDMRRCGELDRCRCSAGNRIRFELQLQRGITWLPGTAARPVMIQSLCDFASPRVRIHRCLQVQPPRESGPRYPKSPLASRSRQKAFPVLCRGCFHVLPLRRQTGGRQTWTDRSSQVCSRLAANCCSLASYASGSIRLAEAFSSSSAGTSGSNLGSHEGVIGPVEFSSSKSIAMWQNRNCFRRTEYMIRENQIACKLGALFRPCPRMYLELCHSGWSVLTSSYPCVDVLTRGFVRLR